MCMAMRALGLLRVGRARPLHGQRSSGRPESRRWRSGATARGRNAGGPRAICRAARSTSSSRSISSTRVSTFQTSTPCCCSGRRKARTLFLQQLGRGLRRAHARDCAPCSTSSAIIAGSSASTAGFARSWAAVGRDVERQIETRLPVPARWLLHGTRPGSAGYRATQSSAKPSRRTGRQGVTSLRSLGDVTLATYLEESGLELEDIYSNNRSWSGLRRATGLPTDERRTARRRPPSGGRPAAPRRRSTIVWPPTDRL